MANYEIYDTFYPSVSVLASLFSLFSCLTDKFIAGLCLYAGDAYLLWMNFNMCSVGSCWLYYASLLLIAYDLVPCLIHECIPFNSLYLQPLKPFKKNPKT